jgi:predicted DNA-binding antitoxin AbrB/MazE fold protein
LAESFSDKLSQRIYTNSPYQFGRRFSAGAWGLGFIRQAAGTGDKATRYNKGAMAIHLEAVYEQGVLRPLEPLALAEHQRVHVTVEERKHPLSWDSAKQLDDSRAELDWITNESRHYPGEWVALDGNRLIAHGPKLAEVKAAAQAAGVSRPFFASVPDDDLPFGGW